MSLFLKHILVAVVIEIPAISPPKTTYFYKVSYDGKHTFFHPQAGYLDYNSYQLFCFYHYQGGESLPSLKLQL